MSGANSDIGAAVQSLVIGEKAETERESAAASESKMDVTAEFANNFPLGFTVDAG